MGEATEGRKGRRGREREDKVTRDYKRTTEQDMRERQAGMEKREDGRRGEEGKKECWWKKLAEK